MIGKLIDYPGPLWRPYSILAVLIFVFVVSPPMMVAMILLYFTAQPSKKTLSGFMSNWLRILLILCRAKIIVHGKKNDISQSACLVISNHQSHFDIPAAYVALKGDLRMLAKRELFLVPLFGWCLSVGGHIQLRRGNRGSAHAAMEAMKEAFKEGIAVWVAPEGTRSENGEIGQYKKGSFQVAIREKIAIQPLCVVYTKDIMPKSSWMPRPGQTAHVHVLPAIFPSGKENPADLADYVRSLTIKSYR